MRAHPVYAAFQKRWQIHTYFQLRWKEIVVKSEEVLTSTRLDMIKGTLSQGNPSFGCPHSFRQRTLFHQPGNRSLERDFCMLEQRSVYASVELSILEADFTSVLWGSLNLFTDLIFQP